MSRMVSFVVLLGILVAIGVLFFKVMAGFLLPLFLAVLLVVMFRPLHAWISQRLPGRRRLAAAATTLVILLIFLIPLLLIFFQAFREGVAIYRGEAAKQRQQAPVQPRQQNAPAPEKAAEGEGAADAPAHRDEGGLQKSPFASLLAEKIATLNQTLGLELDAKEVTTELFSRLQQWLAPMLLVTGQYAVRLVIGLLIMIVALYYFLLDGPAMISAIMRLSPLDNQYESELIAEFDRTARAVVLATVISALVQGILAGIGYYVAGLEAVFLLAVATMLLAMVPFVGAAAVWVPCCLWLFWEDRTTAAILLAVYGVLVVSAIDNVIKPAILHGRSNLHPLLALLSVLGGVKALGPIGIFIGPMAVTFLHALLLMVRKELDAMGDRAPVKALKQTGR